MNKIIRTSLLLIAVVALGMAAEWAAYHLCSESAAELANLVCILVIAIGSGWCAVSLAREVAGLLAALTCGVALWANLYLLKWLWIEPRGHLSVGEFGWGIPWYLGVVTPGACAIAFLVAVLRRRATRASG